MKYEDFTKKPRGYTIPANFSDWLPAIMPDKRISFSIRFYNPFNLCRGKAFWGSYILFEPKIQSIGFLYFNPNPETWTPEPLGSDKDFNEYCAFLKI